MGTKMINLPNDLRGMPSKPDPSSLWIWVLQMALKFIVWEKLYSNVPRWATVSDAKKSHALIVSKQKAPDFKKQKSILSCTLE